MTINFVSWMEWIILKLTGRKNHMIEIYDPKTNSWSSETKEEVLEHEDI